MNFVIGFILFVAAALILAMIVYAFVKREGSKVPGKSSKPKKRPVKKSTLKTPEKVVEKPSPLQPLMERDQPSPKARLTANDIRGVVEKDTDQVVKIIRQWMQEK